MFNLNTFLFCLQFLLVNLISYWLFNKPNLMGGQILLFGYRRIFLIKFFNRGLVLDVKGQNPKEQPSTLEIVSLRKFG